LIFFVLEHSYSLGFRLHGQANKMEAVNASVHIFIFPTAVFLSVRDHQELSPAHQSAAFNLILHHCVSNHTVVSTAAYCCQQYKFSRHHRVMEACFLFTL